METIDPTRTYKFAHLGGGELVPHCKHVCTCKLCGATYYDSGPTDFAEPGSNASPARPLGERVYEAISEHLKDADPMILMIIGSYAETIKGLEDAPLRESLKQLRAATDELLYR